MEHNLIDGREKARIILEDVETRLRALLELGWNPRLVSLNIGDDRATELYVRNQKRTCDKVGITYETRNYDSRVTESEVLATIQALNADPRVTGIILQRPIPRTLDLRKIQNAIHPSKDVEGMNAQNIGSIVYGDFDLGPCTSLAAVHLLRSTGLNLEGLEVVMVGHSEIVGKPIALLLVEALATVTLCHHGTRNLNIHTRRADAVIVAVGKPGLITGDMIKPGAAVIDIGINQVEVSGPHGKVETRVVGDVDFESACRVAGWITPVPGGVGPVTVAMLLNNTVVAVERQKKRYEENVRQDIQ
ncbi:MAG: bifunctional 5,10-methylenetetrahydrofolate dehydrogenase/5,10-methenyltetrahydrofolate cyclohydrolase [Anaerolineales bacterium]|nr:bifunctional 5,10-methylenetetrahydrofolate dehydrogenase/5,10-methenyltetrahydrofolate cyclohydrolase [Anaerolineales bacterium]